MALISLEGMEFYSHHGHYREEQIIGTRFTVDFYYEVDTHEAEQSDELHDTVNYQQVYTIIKEEMALSSKLLEHVARRILYRVSKQFAQVDFAEVRICKLNPPLGGQVSQVCVVLNSEDISVGQRVDPVA